MDENALLDHCLAKPGAYLDFPFGPGVAVVKVRAPTQPTGRLFAQVFTLRGVLTATLSCDPVTAEEYRAIYPGIVIRGYHCPPVQQPYFNSLPLGGEVPDDEILELADLAYEVVFAKLPKYRQREIEQATGSSLSRPPAHDVRPAQEDG